MTKLAYKPSLSFFLPFSFPHCSWHSTPILHHSSLPSTLLAAMIEDEFYARRMAELKCVTSFLIHREMEHEQDKEKLEEERARKREKACRAKVAFLKDGGQVLIKGKWPCRITQD
jgi:hypothetical protein